MRFCTGLMLAWFMTGALAQDAGYVVIYRTDAFVSRLVRVGPEAREWMKPVLRPGRVDMVEWSAFRSEPGRYVAPLVVKNEYPASNLPKLMSDLLAEHPGIPVAVTWTGGIAVSGDDEAHAERLYRLFRENPGEYERTKVSGDQARDPVHPEHHQGATLNVMAPKPPSPWWKCEQDRDDPPARTPAQQRRLEAFGLDRFSPKAPGSNRMDRSFSRSDLVMRFGQPVMTSSKTVRADPQDPTDDSQRIMTTWEYPGFRIVTGAEESSPERLWIDEGEVFDPKVSLGRSVAVGQSIEQWARQFGRPVCRYGEETAFTRLEYEWEASYFTCMDNLETYACQADYLMVVHVDAAGKVARMEWSYAPMH